MTNPKSPTPHDAFFKAAFQNIETARHFLQRFLPPETLAILDLCDITIEPTEFIDEELQRSASDIAFKLKTKAQDTAYVYMLLEHQRVPDKKMAYRLHKYCIRLIDQHLKKHKTKTLPLVVPMILYNGDVPYPYSTSLWDLFDEETQDLAQQALIGPYPLIDLTQLDTREIKDDSWVAVALNALKYGPSKTSPEEMIAILSTATLQLAAVGEMRYIQIVYRYLCEAKDSEYRQQLWQAFQQQLQPQLGETFMTSIADSFRQEGRQEGLEKGIHIGVERGKIEGELTAARRLLNKGYALDEIITLLELEPELEKSLRRETH